VVVVLDDFQEVRDPGVADLLDALLRHPPPALRLVLATRVDPRLPLARLRARGQLAELRAADLRFSAEEAAAYLAAALPVPPSPAAAARLAARIEGWAAGLRLATLALPLGANAAEVGDAIGARRQALALEYLLDEVLARQPQALQDVLLRTAVPERLCAPLVEALLAPGPDGLPATGPDGLPAPGGTLLEGVVQAGLFLTPLDELPERAPVGQDRAPAAGGDPEGPGAGYSWYRYHPLFRDLLLEQLRARRGPATAAALHARAGAWFGAAGLVEDGLHHLRAAGDGAAAVALVEAHIHPALEGDGWPALERWLDLLPPAAGAGLPALALARAWLAHRRGRFDALPGLLAAAGALLDAAPAGPPSQRRALEGQLAALDASVRFLEGDLAGTLAEAGAALARLPPDLHYARGWAAGYAVQAAMAVDGPGAADHWLAAAGAGPAGRDERALARALVGLGCGLVRSGRCPDAERVGLALLDLGQALELHFCRLWGNVLLGAVRYEWDRPAEAEQHFAAALAARDLAPLVLQREATFGLALALQAQGRSEEADAAVERLAGALLATGNTRQLAALDAFRVRLALLRGDHGHGVGPGAGPIGPALPRHLLGTMMDAPPVTRAWAALAARPAPPAGAADLAAADAELGALLAAAGLMHLDLRRAQALALQALLLDAQGQADAALDALEEALTLGQPGGLRRTFLDLGPPLARLLRRLAARRPPGDYLQQLLAAAAGAVSPASRDRRPLGAEDGGDPAEPLTGRELEVLAGLTRGLPNKEIATELVVSPETVKRHAANVYAKLGVSGRRAAVRRAVALGLLPSA
jgi:LuxR family maltose regulon positive regulatory protein